MSHWPVKKTQEFHEIQKREEEWGDVVVISLEKRAEMKYQDECSCASATAIATTSTSTPKPKLCKTRCCWGNRERL